MQTYSLEFENGDPAPDYYRIDSMTGAVHLENKYYQLVDDSIVVAIASTDGVQTHYPHI